MARRSRVRHRSRTLRPAALLALFSICALGMVVSSPPDVAEAQEVECSEPAWSSEAVYVGGDRVTHDNQIWQAKWWTRGEQPGTTGPWGVWADQGPCGGDPGGGDPGECAAAPWSATAVYVGGDQVTHDDRRWQAEWWTQGEEPGVTASGVWADQGPCGDGDPGDDEPPPAPTGLTVAGTTATSVSLSWNAATGADDYLVTRDGVEVGATVTTGFTDTGLQPETTHTYTVAARNTAGTSPASAPVAATTDVGDDAPPGSVPRHAVTGYWQNFDNGAAVQRLTDVPDAFDIVAVAFADATATPGQITFNLDPATGYASEQEFKNDIAALQAQGKAVIISVGGALGRVSVNSPAAAQAFATSAVALMDEFGFDGVDIDMESGINATFMTQAMQSIHDQVGDRLVYTMAPQTLDMQSTGTQYFQLALNTQDFLTVVNTQYYNSGSMLGCDDQVYSQGGVDFVTALACIQLEGGLDAAQVGLGFPASSRAAGSGFVSPSVVTAALDCLTRGTRCGSFQPPQTYPDLRGAMTWSTNWDETNGFAWSDVVGPHVDGLP